MTNEEFIESIRLPNEEWRPVVGWDYDYVVSSFGRVASLKKSFTDKNGVTYNRRPRLFIPHKNTNGYMVTALTKNGIPITVTIHRLVAKAFLDKPSEYNEIDHIDRNRTNNNVTNLRWCNHSINMKNTTYIHRNLSRAKAVARIDKNGNIKTYTSISLAAKDGFTRTSIALHCKDGSKPYKGFLWRLI